ncbi:PD-(D/E)XK nuclease family protein [Gordonia rhizosphera]|uniref:Uncharacterized protein n=1 Tax=Gordonia rhizosphera NBRC 16068 TaxID=1108045 RepID=K6WA08_9ACTN|nr:PD-(D/E)XK nuclease family protein [Gordonia rhizosphera]GAB90596.1 hypothetical protein GORHZ_110_00080 [Gordonia rhizosphera NBRC 16068]
MDQVEKKERLTKLAAEMRADPLSRIMYGSRELFHSNFLAWMCEEFPDLANAISGVVPTDVVGDPSAGVDIRREWKNLDLYMTWGGAAPLVIENKVFSIPGTGQLDVYADKLRKAKLGADVRAVLLSLSDPGWPSHTYRSPGKLPIDWHYVSYGQLSDALERSVAAGRIEVSYKLETIRRYIILIRRLQDIADLLQVDDESEPVFIAQWAESMDDRQFVNAVSKLRAEIVKRYVEARLPSDDVKRLCSAGMSNSTPLIQAFYPQGATKRAHLGWQLQGQQFRLFAVLPDLAGRTKGQRDKRIDWGMAHSKLFDFSTIAPLTGDPERPVKPDNSFNRFDPDFIYRYIAVPNLTVGELDAVARQRHADLLALLQR